MTVAMFYPLLYDYIVGIYNHQVGFLLLVDTGFVKCWQYVKAISKKKCHILLCLSGIGNMPQNAF